MDMQKAMQNTEGLEFEVGELNPDDLAAMMGGLRFNALGGFLDVNTITPIDFAVDRLIEFGAPVFGDEGLTGDLVTLMH